MESGLLDDLRRRALSRNHYMNNGTTTVRVNPSDIDALTKLGLLDAGRITHATGIGHHTGIIVHARPFAYEPTSPDAAAGRRRPSAAHLVHQARGQPVPPLGSL